MIRPDDGKIALTEFDAHTRKELYEEIESMRQKLSAALAAIKVKDEDLKVICDDFDHDNDAHKYGTTCRCCLAGEALAIQPDDSALKAWLGEPVAYWCKHKKDDESYKKLTPYIAGAYRWLSQYKGDAAEVVELYSPKWMTK